MTATNKEYNIKAILTISVAFLALGVIKKWEWSLYVSIVVGAIGVLSDKLSSYIVFFWNKLSLFLGIIMPNVILAPIFFLFLFPLSVLARIFRKTDALQIRNNAKSMYKIRDKEYDSSHFENMW